MATISKAKAIESIYLEIEKGITYTTALRQLKGKLGVKSDITFDAYWKQAKARFEKRQEKTTEAIANREANKVIHELETKDGQINSLVKQIQDIEKEIESGQTVECTWVRDEFHQDKRPLNGNEIRDRRALIKSLLSDIRQIRGLNAPKENKLTVKQEIDELVKSGDVIPIDSKDDTGKELAQING